MSKIKKLLKDNDLLSLTESTEKTENLKTGKQVKRKSFELKFPWWFKIIAYALSFAFATVSLFFVVIKGIEFGEEKVTKWLTSLIISFLSSVLLIQPFQV